MLSQSTMRSDCCHLCEARFTSSDMLRRRITLTMVSSSMLAETSMSTSTRLPPSFSPLRYWRLPSPVKLRMFWPVSPVFASMRFFSSCIFFRSCLSFSISAVWVMDDAALTSPAVSSSFS